MPILQQRIDKLLSFSGPIAAPLTPTNGDGSPNESPDIIRQYVTYLDSIGVKGLYIHGTTGEGLSIPHEVKKRLLKIWVEAVKAVNPSILIIPNVTSTCFFDSKDLAQFCESLQVDGIAVLSPFYYRPPTPDKLVTYVKAISDCAPTTPLYYYHNPEKTRVDVPITTFVDLCVIRVRAFCGLKFASRNMTELAYLERTHGRGARKMRVKFFAACGDTMLSSAIHGIDSANCSLFNLEESVTAFNEIVAAVSGDGRVVDIATARKAQALLDQQVKEFNIEDGGNYLRNLRREVETRVDFVVGDCLPPLCYF